MKTNALTEWFTRINTPKPNFGQLVLFLIAFAWVIYIFARGYQLLGMILALFLLLTLLRVPYVVPVFALVAVIVLFHIPIISTWTGIIESNKAVLGNPRQVLIDLFTPSSGLEGLSEQATSAVLLMQNHHINRYQLSNQVLQNPSVTQRITEMAWPRRMDRSSQYVLIFLKEQKDYQTCTILDQQKEIALEDCH